MKIQLSCLLMFICIALSAQTSGGVLFGVNTTDLGTSQIKVPTAQIKDSLKISLVDADYGFHLGGYLRFRRNSFYIQPEVLLNSTKINYKLSSTKSFTTLDTLRSERFFNIDIPLMVGVKFSIIRLSAGPVMHVLLNNSSELKDLEGFESKYKGANYGYQLGLGFDFSKICIDLRHEGNFTKYGEHVTFFGETFKFSNKASRLIATIGYKF